MRWLLALVLLPTVAVADGVASPKRQCAGDSRVMAAAQGGRGGFQRLDRLPPSKAFLALYREVDGCHRPVVVRRDIGAPRR